MFMHTQPRAELKSEAQGAPLRPRDQRAREKLTFTPRVPRPGNANTHSPHHIVPLSYLTHVYS